MRRLLIIAFALLAASGLGIGGYFAFRGGDDDGQPRAHPGYLEEAAAKRDHVTLVISGRLMAEIFPCG